MKTPILGSTYVARSVNAADARMVNLFPEIVPEGGKEPVFLQRCPGLQYIQSVGSGPIRGLWAHQTNKDSFYVASGSQFFRVPGLNVDPILLGSISGEGPVSIADNGNQLFIATNPNGYIYNETTQAFGPIADTDFLGAVTVTYLDGYFVFNEPNSQKIWVTALFDGTSINPLDYASAEGSPDGVVCVFADHRELWVFGTDTTEVWYNAGGVDFPFARIQGAFNELGCAAPYSVAKMANQIYWLGRDQRGGAVVYRANGYIGERVSTHAVEWHIQQYGDVSGATGYTYQQEGHSFYVLNFPVANTTWVFDVATNAWHERASLDNGVFSRHRGNNMCYFNDQILIGDYKDNNIYAFNLDVYEDNGQTQKWLRSWRALPTGQNNLRRTAQHSLQLDCETGIGTALYSRYEAQILLTESGLEIVGEWALVDITTESGDVITCEANGSFASLVLYTYEVPDFSGEPLTTSPYPALPSYDPQVMLRWSDDGGHTWSNEHWKSMGKIGEYKHRTIWRRLGMTTKIRDRVYEVSGTAAVKIYVMGAELILNETNA